MRQCYTEDCYEHSWLDGSICVVWQYGVIFLNCETKMGMSCGAKSTMYIRGASRHKPLKELRQPLFRDHGCVYGWEVVCEGRSQWYSILLMLLLLFASNRLLSELCCLQWK